VMVVVLVLLLVWCYVVVCFDDPYIWLMESTWLPVLI
jgi:hypothetical protein